MFYTYILCAGGIVVLATIIIRGIQIRIFARYKWFYAYISYVLSAAVVGLAFLSYYGRNSAEYAYAFHLPNLLVPWFHLAILFDVRRRVVGNSKFTLRRAITSAILVALPTLPVAVKVFSSAQASFFYRYHAVMLFWQMLACVLIYRAVSSQRDVEPGRNLRGILLGIATLVGLQAMNFAHILFFDTAAEVFYFFLQFIYFSALAVFAYTLWNYSPLRAVRPSHLERLNQAGEDLEKAVRILISQR